jgi:hypothetical protein
MTALPLIPCRVLYLERTRRGWRAGWALDWVTNCEQEEANVLHHLRRLPRASTLHEVGGSWWVSAEAIGTLAARWPALAQEVARATP